MSSNYNDLGASLAEAYRARQEVRREPEDKTMLGFCLGIDSIGGATEVAYMPRNLFFKAMRAFGGVEGLKAINKRYDALRADKSVPKEVKVATLRGIDFWNLTSDGQSIFGRSGMTENLSMARQFIANCESSDSFDGLFSERWLPIIEQSDVMTQAGATKEDMLGLLIWGGYDSDPKALACKKALTLWLSRLLAIQYANTKIQKV